MQLLFADVWVLHHLQAHVVKTLQGAHTGGTNGNDLAVVSQQSLQRMTAHGDIFCMHGVFADGIALDRFECSRTHVQRHFLTLNATSINVLQYTLREVKPSGRSSHTTLNLRIDCLVSGFVALLRLTIQVWRNRQFTHLVENFGEVHTFVVPLKVYPLTRSVLSTTRGRNSYFFILNS